jgi:hypothetical protein
MLDIVDQLKKIAVSAAPRQPRAAAKRSVLQSVKPRGRQYEYAPN